MGFQRFCAPGGPENKASDKKNSKFFYENYTSLFSFLATHHIVGIFSLSFPELARKI